MKKIILIMTILLLVSGCQSKDEEAYDNVVSNRNQEISVPQTINDIVFDNQSITYQNNISTVTFRITNHSTNMVNINNIYIVIKNENDTVVTSLNVNVSNTLDSNEQKLVTAYSDIDLSNIYKLEFNFD